MALFEDDRPEKKPEHRLGEELAMLSLDELRARIDLLKAEIVRLEEAIRAKEVSRASAADFFKS